MATLYSLDMLPVVGIENPAQTVNDANAALKSTLSILDGIDKAGYGLSAAVEQELTNVRFHVVNGLSFIDAHLRRGGLSSVAYNVVIGLPAAISDHINAIKKAKPTWNSWLLSARTNRDPTTDVALPPYQPVISNNSLSSVGGEITKPLALADYLGIGVVAAGLWLGLKLFK